jgi:hypothetical protein
VTLSPGLLSRGAGLGLIVTDSSAALVVARAPLPVRHGEVQAVGPGPGTHTGSGEIQLSARPARLLPGM